MLVQTASSQLGLLRVTAVLLENSIAVRIREQHKRMEFQPSMQDPWLHEPDTIFSVVKSTLRSRNRDSSLHATVSSPLHSSLCALLPKQDVQPNSEH
ncbi:hypothetical protein TNCV_2875481 [Trichonephila clavipes]|nr:hypothetical protein TNCV_2875481 [Trichonephila clavipes]